jgi:hypothetical protein
MATTTESIPTRPSSDSFNGDGGRQPDAPTPFQAIWRHPFLALLPVLLLVGGAVAFGQLREPTWTSESRLSVGELSPSTQSAPGIVEANQQLASAYSRAVDAQRVLVPVSRELGIPTREVSARLSASPVPESPVVKVSATGTGEREAVVLAQVGTSSLVRYIRRLGNRNPEAERLLSELTDARREVAKLQAETLPGTGPNPDLDAAKLRAKSLETQYLETTQRGGATPITELNPAEVATSDRDKVLKLAIVIGALGGIAVGAALATLRASALRRRRLALS